MKHSYSKLIYATAAVVLAFMIFLLHGQDFTSGTTYVYPGNSNTNVKTASTKVSGKLLDAGSSSGNNVLHELDNELTNVASKINPSVVTIFVAQKVKVRQSPFNFGPFSFFNGPQGGGSREETEQAMGSGVIVSNDGYILTNNHVVQHADTISVRLSNGKKLPAKLVGRDPKTDIAVIRINAKNLPVATLGNSDNVKVGQIVLAVGSPLSPDLANTVTMGIISAKGRTQLTHLSSYSDYLQTDAAINPGNSGGALINVDGDVIGINSAIATQTGGNQGIGFAIPINMAKNIMEQLIKHGKVIRGYLGVIIQPVTPSMAKAFNLNSDNGAVVGQVESGSPADKAGLKAGDVILKLNGKTIKDYNEFRNEIAGTEPGKTVTLTVLRDGKQKEIKVKLGDLSNSQFASSGSSKAESLFNFSVHNISQQLADKYGIQNDMKGVVVTKIDHNSAAYQGNLREGDVIVAADRHRVKNVADFNKAMEGVKKGDTVLLRVVQGNRMFFIAFEVD